MAAERMLKSFVAAIFFSGAVTSSFAQQLDAAAPSTEPMPGFRDGNAGTRKELQRELLGLSTASRRVIATKSGHNIQREEPRLVIDAVLDVVQQVRNRK